MPTPLPPILPDPDTLAAQLRAALPTFKHIEWVERTTSTNGDLLAQAREGMPKLARPWLRGAHLQDQGRGRAGRTWQNRSGANLMFSCAFDVFLPARLLPALSPLAGITACEALRALIGAEHRLHLTMKWPNDLQWKSSKLAGILVEVTRAGASPVSSDHHVAIIGIGINLDDARSLSQSLDRQIADWGEIAAQDELAATATAARIAGACAQAWYDGLNTVTRDGFDDIPARHAQVDALAGRHIDVLDNGRLVHAGIACGIDTLGQLRVRTPSGEKPVVVGEVSVRT